MTRSFSVSQSFRTRLQREQTARPVENSHAWRVGPVQYHFDFGLLIKVRKRSLRSVLTNLSAYPLDHFRDDRVSDGVMLVHAGGIPITHKLNSGFSFPVLPTASTAQWASMS